MELAILVWAISCLNGLTLLIALIILSLLGCLLIDSINISDHNNWNNKTPLPYKMYKWVLPTVLALSMATVAIPSQKTAYIMVGAYAAQKVSQDPRAQQVEDRVLKVINKQLDNLLEESTKK